MKNGKIYSKKLLSLVLVICLMPLTVINPIQVGASGEYNIVKDVLWDIDFEDETLDLSISPYVAICDSSGNALRNPRGDIFRCHTGSTASEFKIADGVLSFNPANTTDEVQTNEFFTTISDGAAVFKLKVKVDDYNTSKNVFRLVYLDENGVVYWAPQLRIKQHVGVFAWGDSSFAVTGGTDSTVLSGTQTLTCKKNTWYEIETRFNLEDNTFSYMVNSTVLASGTLGKKIASTQRVSIAPEAGESKAKASKLYVDDIYFYEATNVPYTKMHINVDGKESIGISEGDLSVWGEISNGYGAIDCVFALYKGNKLEDVRVFKNISDGTNWVSTDTVDFGYVDYSHEVKMIMVKSNDGITPAGKCLKADKHGVSAEIIDINTIKTIFESEDGVKNIMADKIGYHPSSGYVTKNGTKTAANLKGITEDDVLMVPAELFGYFGYDVAQTDSGAKIGEYTLTADSTAVAGSTLVLDAKPYKKDEKIYVPLKCIIEKLFGKTYNQTKLGRNNGAVIISDYAYSLPTNEAESRRLNEYLLYERPDSQKILTDYSASEKSGVHPRVIMTDADFERIKKAQDTISVSKKARVKSRADGYLKESVLKYELRDGVRLWYVSMAFMDRVMSLSFAYKMTGNRDYLNKCIAEMDSISEFESWHPEHHIDVGGLAVGFAIGYDWLYNDLSAGKRAKYEAAIYKLCFDQYYKGFTGVSSDMSGGIVANNNHNSVMNAGITLCAIAFMDEFPDECAYFMENTIKATEYTIHNFFPDGAWYEGVGYGCMTLEYLALQLAATQNMFGTLYGMDAVDGMDDAGRFPVNMQSPAGAFAFYDGGDTHVQWHSGALWFAEHFGTEDVILQWKNFYNVGEEARADVACLMYYNPESAKVKNKTEVRWDVDFESVYAGEHRWKYPYVSIYSTDGSVLSSSGDTLTAHSGTTANNISTINTKDSTHGKALSLKANDSAEVQLNEFLTGISGDVIEFEYDYRLETLPTTGSGASIFVMHPVVDDGTWLNALTMGISGQTPYFTCGGRQKTASVGTWYKIRGSVDTKSKKLVYYIDDEYFSTSSFSAPVAKGKKIVSKIANAPGATVWIDNFKVYAITFDKNVDYGKNDVFYAKNNVVTMRDSRTSSIPVFVGAKGGFAADDHGHMDMGTFCFYSHGVQWLGIHGGADYNLPNFWQGGDKYGMRWKYFTMRAEAHNCLVINPDEYAEYDPMANAEFVRFENNDNSAIAVLDMTNVHGGKATDAKRGYFFTDNRQSLVVRDEVTVSQNSDIYFFLITEHNVTIDGNKAIFTDKAGSGNSLIAEFVCSGNFELTAETAKPLPTSPNPENNPTMSDITRICLKTSGSGAVSVTAKLTPLGVTAGSIAEYNMSISNWKLK